MPIQSLLKETGIVYGSGYSAAGTTDQDSAVVDMQNYESLCCIFNIGDVTSGAVLELQVFGNTASSTSSPSPVEITDGDCSITAGASNADNGLFIVDVPRWNPTYRYAFARMVIDTQNAVSNGFVLIPYNPRTVPVTSTAVVSAVLAPKG